MPILAYHSDSIYCLHPTAQLEYFLRYPQVFILKGLVKLNLNSMLLNMKNM